MSDYIKREDAKRAIRRYFHDLGTRCMINNVINEVAKVSSDNLVEVVRCKDCKHKPIEDDRDSWPTFPNEGDNPCPCQCDDGFYSWVPKDDFYCGYGERADT